MRCSASSCDALTDGVRILVVCTANICRSVMAEAFLGSEARRRGLPAEVSSAGFLRNGEPASDAVTTVMGERGLDVTAHRSRITTPKILAAADLVVTMERRHGRDIGAMGRGCGVFTMTCAARHLAAVDPAETDPVNRLHRADAARVDGDLLGTGPDEIDDPFGRSLLVNRMTADRIAALSVDLLGGIFPEPD